MNLQQDSGLSAQETVSELGSDIDNGLTIEKAHERIHSRGRNSLRLPRARKAVRKIKKHAFNLMNVTLIIMAAAHLLIVGIDGADVAAKFFVCALVNIIISRKNFKRVGSSALAARRAQEQDITVVRSGIKKPVPAVLLVQGDIVFLEKGQLIPADVKIIESDHAVLDERLMDGNSSSVVKTKNDSLYMGTKLVSGSIKAVVTAVGEHTRLGAGIGRLDSSGKEASLLARKCENICNIFSVAAIIVWLLSTAAIVACGKSVVAAVGSALVQAAAVLPVALPAMLLITVELDMLRLKRSGVKVHSFSAPEAVGTADVLCVGTRGTLTKNCYEVSELHAFGGFDEKRLRLLGAMCNTVKTDSIKDPMQEALICEALYNGFTNEDVWEKEPLVAVTDERSDKKIMTTVHKADKGCLTICKGAPEAVAACCTYIYDGGMRRLDHTKDLHSIISESNDMSARGMTVIAVAYSEEEGGELIFAGLMGLECIICPDAPASVDKLAAVGVRVCLVTNEKLSTAAAVAEKCALKGRSVNADEIDLSAGRQLRTIAAFADASPARKGNIVAALDGGSGRVVAVGRSDRDVEAMNNSAASIITEASSKLCADVADISVGKEGMSSIAEVVCRCKRMMANIEKMTEFMLSCNVAMAVCVVSSLIMSTALPFSFDALVWLNIVTMIGALWVWSSPDQKLSFNRSRIKRMKQPSVSGELLFGALVRGAAMGAVAFLASLTEYPLRNRFVIVATLTAAILFMAQSCRGRDEAKKPFVKRRVLAALVLVAFAAVGLLFVHTTSHMVLFMESKIALCIVAGALPALAAEGVKQLMKNKSGKVKKHGR